MKIDGISEVLATVMRRSRVAAQNVEPLFSNRNERKTVHEATQTTSRDRMDLQGGDAILGAISPENLFAIGAKGHPTPGRIWESYYFPEVQGEPHPQNRFVEGYTLDGATIVNSADYYARTFVPAEVDIQGSLDMKASSIVHEHTGMDRKEHAASQSVLKSAFSLAVFSIALAVGAVLIRNIPTAP